MKKKLICYSSNNSGGSWWLDEKDWKALEDVGWRVLWFYEKVAEKNGKYLFDKETGLPIIEKIDIPTCNCEPPREAVYMAHSLEEAIASFENATGQDAYAEGCPCCGRPHDFYVMSDRC